MSKTGVNNLPKDLQPDVLLPKLESYHNDYDEAEARVALKGKTLAIAAKEQAAWTLYYKSRKAELDKLCKRLYGRVEATRGVLYKQYTENYSRELSDRAKDKYIDGDEDFIKINELYLEVREIYEKISAVVETFEVRGFAIRDLTTATVHSIQDGTL